jgi:hypothetical protein
MISLFFRNRKKIKEIQKETEIMLKLIKMSKDIGDSNLVISANLLDYPEETLGILNKMGYEYEITSKFPIGFATTPKTVLKIKW